MERTLAEDVIAGDCIAARVRILNRVVTGIYDDALRPYGLRISQMNILAVVAAIGPVRQADVCSWLCLDKSTLSRDLGRMVAHGWVRSTAGPGRTVLLEATDAGRTLLKEVLPAWRVAQQVAAEVLTPAAVRGVVGAVERLWAEQE